VLGIAVATVDNHPHYVGHKKGRKLLKPVLDLRHASGYNLQEVGGVEELKQFQGFLPQYKTVSNRLFAESLFLSVVRICTCRMIRNENVML
jgi:hypothetical protein